MALGRPTLYTDELAAEICRLIAIHPISLNKICAKYSALPCVDTITEWRLKYSTFSAMYYRAKEAQTDNAADYAWDRVQDVDERPEAIAKASLELKHIQWQNARLSAKVWGDKREIKSDVTVSVHEKDLESLK